VRIASACVRRAWFEVDKERLGYVCRMSALLAVSGRSSWLETVREDDIEEELSVFIELMMVEIMKDSSDVSWRE
jgi:hypothetical protein